MNINKINIFILSILFVSCALEIKNHDSVIHRFKDNDNTWHYIVISKGGLK